MNRRTVTAILRKDISTIARNRGVRLPLIITPIVVLVALPVLLVLSAQVLASSAPEAISEAAPPLLGGAADEGLRSRLVDGMEPQAAWGAFTLEVFIAPLFLLIPLIVATVIAADSFAGERERGTLEALLHTPATDRELMTAKFLAAWLPALTVAWVGFAVYSVLANALLWPSFGMVWFPTPTWLLLAFWVAPGLSALGLALMVIASSRVRTLQAAHQLGSLVVLPMILLLIAQVSGVYMFSVGRVAILGILIWMLAVVALRWGTVSLRRGRLAERL